MARSASNTQANTAQFVVGRRQLYILPTRFGWYFSLILIALFAIAVKFDNQAAFMMLFILIGLGNAVMLATHRNLIGVGVDKGVPSSSYAQQECGVLVNLSNPNERARRAIYVNFGPHSMLVNLEPNERKQIKLEYPTPLRGIHAFPDLILSSQYPSGLFFCWTKMTEFEHQIMVYPEAKDLVHANQLSESGDHDASDGVQRQQQGDFQGLRNYQEGDRLRDVHWPSYAKNQKLISKEYESPGVSMLMFDWHSLPKTMPEEEKLSQLSFWLTQAEHRAGLYGLKIPTSSIALNNGPRHLHECLSLLAVHEAAPVLQAGQSSSIKPNLWRRLKNRFKRNSKPNGIEAPQNADGTVKKVTRV